jgi:nitrous oxidase accessory protein
MEYNRFEKNWGPASYGILLKDITDSVIRENIFFGNSIGLYAEASNRIEVKNNNFRANGWAVKIMANSMDNIFTENDFIDNAFDVATNSGQNFNTFENNYWSRYKGYDLDRDGIGDVPYRPVRLFSIIVEKQHPALILLKSFFISVLDIAESIFPVLTPQTLMDQMPRMRPII